jgi:hypothetical protein
MRGVQGTRWRSALAAALAAGALGPARPARADTFLIQSGQDSSPYAFLPGLPRGFYNTAYAFTLLDAGQDHSFEYYLRFDLPPELLEPGVEIEYAYAFVYYGFDYNLFGDFSDEIGEILCHEVLEPWSQTSLTWNNRPAIGTWFDAREEILNRGSYWCDVTEVLRGWIAHPGTNHGIALTSGLPRVIGFYTFDDGVVSPNLKPSLLVETVPLPEPGVASGLGAGGLLLLALARRRARRSAPTHISNRSPS